MGWKRLYKLAPEQVRAKACEILGPDRHATLLALGALDKTGKKIDAKVVADLLGIELRAAQKWIAEIPKPPRS